MHLNSASPNESKGITRNREEALFFRFLVPRRFQMLKPRNVLLAITVAALVCFATNSAEAQQRCYSPYGNRGYSNYRVPAYSSYSVYRSYSPSPYRSYRAYPSYQNRYPSYGYGNRNYGYGGRYYGGGVGIGIQGNRGGGFYIRF